MPSFDAATSLGLKGTYEKVPFQPSATPPAQPDQPSDAELAQAEPVAPTAPAAPPAGQPSDEELKAATPVLPQPSLDELKTARRVYTRDDVTKTAGPDLAKDREFSPTQFAIENPDAATDPEVLQQLLGVYRAHKIEGVTKQDVVKGIQGIPDAAVSVGKGIVARGKNVLQMIFKEPSEMLHPDQNEKSDAQAKKALVESAAATESATHGIANLVKGATEKLVHNNPLARLAEKGSPARAALWENLTPDQLKEHFFSDVENSRQAGAIASGEGENLKRGGWNAAELEKEGIKLDPANIESLTLTDPLTTAAFAGGFKVINGVTGKVLALAPTAAAAELAKKGLTQIAAGAAKTAGKVVGAAEPVANVAAMAAPLVGGIGGLVKSGPVGALVGYKGGEIAAGALRKTATVAGKVGEKLGELGTQIENNALPTGARRILDVANAGGAFLGDIGKGAAVGTGLALAASESPEDTQNLIAYGGGFGAIPGVKAAAGELVKGEFIKPRNSFPQARPVVYGDSPVLDKASAAAFSKLPPEAQNNIGFVQGLARKLGARVYVLPPEGGAEVVKQVVPGISDERAALIAESQGYTTTLKAADGQPITTVFLNANNDAAPHELGHVIERLLGDDQNKALDEATKKSLTPEGLEALGSQYATRHYPGTDPAAWRDTMKVDAQGFPSVEDYMVRESRAEHVSELLNNRGAEIGTPEDFYRRLVGAVGRGAEKLGAPLVQARSPDLKVPLSLDVLKQHDEALAGVLGDKEARKLVQARDKALIKASKAKPSETPKTTEKPQTPLAAQTPAVSGISDRQKAAVESARKIADEITDLPANPGAPQPPSDQVHSIADAMEQGQAVHAEFYHAPGEKPSEFSSQSVLSDPKVREGVIEAARELPIAERELFGSSFYPLDVRKSKEGPFVQAYTPSVIMANAVRLVKSLAKANLADRIPFEYDAKRKSLTPAGWQQLNDSLKVYVANHEAGRTGAGEQLVVPHREGYFAPEEKPAAGELAPSEQDFLNATFGIERQISNRIASSKKVPLNIMGQEVSEATEPGRVSEIPGAPVFEGAKAAALGIEGRAVAETNPLLAELRAAGEDPKLFSASQRIFLKHIAHVRPEPNAPRLPANLLTLEGGFRPKPSLDLQIKRRLDESKVKEPVFHTTLFDYDRADPEAAQRNGPASLFGMHFGTREQAGDIASRFLKIDKKAPVRTSKYNLELKNPVRMTDDGANDPTEAMGELLQQKIFTPQDFEDVIQRTRGSKDQALRRAKVIQQKLLEKGYDGIVYNNGGEESGGDSYVAFDENQIINATAPRFDTEGVAFLPKKAAEVAEMNPDEFAEWAQSLKGRGFTQEAYKVGHSVDNAEDAAQLRDKYDELRKQADTLLKAGDVQRSLFAGAQAQFFREAWEAAGGLGSARFEQEGQFSPKTKAGTELERKGFDFKEEDYGGKAVRVSLFKGNKEIADIIAVKKSKTEAKVEMVHVEPLYRNNNNIGETLYRELASRLQSQGITDLTGEVVAPEPLAIRRKLFGEGNTEVNSTAGGDTVEKMSIPEAQNFIREKRRANDLFMVEARSKISPTAQFSPKAGQKEHEFWLGRSGKMTPAPEGHLEAGFDLLPNGHESQDVYADMRGKGYHRVVVADAIYSEGGTLTSSQRKSLEDLAFERDLPVKVNSRWADFGPKSDGQARPAKLLGHPDAEREIEMVKQGESDGQTFNRDGSIYTPATHEKKDVVTLASVNVPRDELTPEKVREALAPYSAALEHEEVKPGVFKMTKTDDKGNPLVSIDLNAVVDQAHRDNSVKFAHDNNQEAIFDLHKFENVSTEGNGETLLKTPEQIASVLPELLAGKPVDVAAATTGADGAAISQLVETEGQARPKAPTDDKLEAFHYSASSVWLKKTDPKRMKPTVHQFWGEQPKTFFFVKGSEDAAGPQFHDRTLYSTTFDRSTLYDPTVGKDPLGYLSAVNRSEAEGKVKKAGYDGVLVPIKDGKQVIVSFKPQPVEIVGNVDSAGNLHKGKLQGERFIREEALAGQARPKQPEPTTLAEDVGLPGFDVGRSYNRRAISEMTKEELKAHFPEAIIPRSSKETIPSDIVDSPLAKEAGSRGAAIKAFADKLVEFAKANQHDPAFDSGAKWYSEFTPMLKKEFGADAPIFAELLAATSPQTDPHQNFDYAFDAFQKWKRGDYNRELSKFEEGIEKLSDGRLEAAYKRAVPSDERPENLTPAALMGWWVEKHDLIVLGTTGKKIGLHSGAVLQVLARRWLTDAKGPKTQNFVKNLLGTGDEATIDLWADRTMRRLGYEGHKDRWRILPENAEGVRDDDFKFSQEAFRAAAEQLKMKPSDLQGALWFAEKKLWADKGWGSLNLGDYRTEIKGLEMRRRGWEQREKLTGNKPLNIRKKGAKQVDLFENQGSLVTAE